MLPRILLLHLDNHVRWHERDLRNVWARLFMRRRCRPGCALHMQCWLFQRRRDKLRVRRYWRNLQRVRCRAVMYRRRWRAGGLHLQRRLCLGGDDLECMHHNQCHVLVVHGGAGLHWRCGSGCGLYLLCGILLHQHDYDSVRWHERVLYSVWGRIELCRRHLRISGVHLFRWLFLGGDDLECVHDNQFHVLVVRC